MPLKIVGPIVITCVKTFAIVYEYLTWPIYYFSYRPDERLKASSRIRAVNVGDSPAGPYRCVEATDQPLATSLFPGCLTLDDLFRRAVKLWPDAAALGTRELLEEFDEVQPNGRVFKKQVYGEYHWESYTTLNDRIDAFGFGLLQLGHKPGASLMIFSETRAEWMIAAQTCFRFNFPLTTQYATLGNEAIIHGVNEADVGLVLTSASLVPKLVALLPKMTSVKHIIYMNHGVFHGSEPLPASCDQAQLLACDVQLHSMLDVEQLGSGWETRAMPRPESPQRSSQAIIMYTSGSTALPKGVVISHGNLMSGMAGQGPRINRLGPADIYFGYLPLAHVLELSAEVCCLAMGTRIGYSSPATLTDMSPKIKRGSKGDAAALRPTLMAAVPVIMDRISKNVWEKVRDGGDVALTLFTWAYGYKRARLESGAGSFFLDKFVFKRIRALLGGRVRLMLCGGAPLAQETQRFMTIVFDCPILQGYGLTETCGAGTISSAEDMSTGRCGAALSCVELWLRDWEEGGYRAADLPRPRGEILLGGGNITQGYFKQPDKTAEDFFVDARGQRWFCSGDIGTFHDDGTLHIIDRKKDLVKLQAGEYVSLGKVETALGQSIYVETVCAFGDGLHNYMVALVVPKRKALAQLANKLNVVVASTTSTADDGVEMDKWQAYCQHAELRAALLKDMQTVALKHGLERFELPQQLFLTPEPWTPETGLVTDAFKLKRKPIQEKFQAQITAMYAQ